MPRKFSTEIVLRLTTGTIYCIFSELSNVWFYLTGAAIYTHQLSAALEEVRPYILQQYPGLSALLKPTEQAIAPWLVTQIAQFGDASALEPLPVKAARPDPITELFRMRRQAGQLDDSVIIVPAKNRP